VPLPSTCSIHSPFWDTAFPDYKYPRHQALHLRPLSANHNSWLSTLHLLVLPEQPQEQQDSNLAPWHPGSPHPLEQVPNSRILFHYLIPAIRDSPLSLWWDRRCFAYRPTTAQKGLPMNPPATNMRRVISDVHLADRPSLLITGKTDIKSVVIGLGNCLFRSCKMESLWYPTQELNWLFHLITSYVLTHYISNPADSKALSD